MCREWDKELSKKNSKPSLLKALIRLQWFNVFKLSIIIFVEVCTLQFFLLFNSFDSDFNSNST